MVVTLNGGGGLVTKLCLTLATPWTIARQAPLSMGFSRQEYWRGLPFPSPGNLPYPGVESGLMPSHNTYHLTWVSLTLDVGYLSWLLQQSAAAAPCLGRGVSPHGCPS